MLSLCPSIVGSFVHECQRANFRLHGTKQRICQCTALSYHTICQIYFLIFLIEYFNLSFNFKFFLHPLSLCPVYLNDCVGLLRCMLCQGVKQRYKTNKWQMALMMRLQRHILNYRQLKSILTLLRSATKGESTGQVFSSPRTGRIQGEER